MRGIEFLRERHVAGVRQRFEIARFVKSVLREAAIRRGFLRDFAESVASVSGVEIPRVGEFCEIVQRVKLRAGEAIERIGCGFTIMS
jgi:hypothetical protein